MRDAKETSMEISKLVQRLPLLDNSVEKLLSPSGTDAADRNELIQLVKEDSGLCSELLMLANSSCHAGMVKMPIETVEEAWDQIGIEQLRMLVGTAAIVESVHLRFLNNRGWREYVVHSQAICRGCRILAELKGLPDHMRATFSVAGLTHDIGRVIIMIATDARQASLMGTLPEHMEQVVKDEQAAYGLNHCVVGHDLFRRWNFSPLLQEGIQRHHTPLMGEDFSYPGAIIFISHFISMSDFTGKIIAKMLGEPVLNLLELTQADLQKARDIYDKLP
ncbi:MAG: HDOD domain-containing protein [Victivallales bacterium]|jgi:HD-like signal output (HDOD) protein